MGNILYVPLSLKGFSNSTIFADRSSPSLNNQYVVSVEERSQIFESFFSFYRGMHSFLVLKTSTGECIRVDYHANTLEPDIQYHYYVEIDSSEVFRQSIVQKPVTLEQALRIIRRHCVNKRYDLISHNCQHVARDSFCEITGVRTLLLRNDYLEWLKRDTPEIIRDELGFKDDILTEIKNTTKKYVVENKLNFIRFLLDIDKHQEQREMMKYWEKLDKFKLDKLKTELGRSEHELK